MASSGVSCLLRRPYDQFRTESVRNTEKITPMSFALVGLLRPSPAAGT
jgi:hypothetical protein